MLPIRPRVVLLLFVVGCARLPAKPEEPRAEPANPAAPPTLAYEAAGPSGNDGRFVLTNAPKEGEIAIAVRVGDNETPILGKLERAGETAVFRPRFPLAFDAPITASATRAGNPLAQTTLILPRPMTPPTRIAAVFPTAETLPENVLRFYVHFSAPMRTGEASQRVRILDANGKAVERAFLELDEELWNAEGTRLTLLIDPGRIKRGVKPREDDGTVFEAGKNYTLEIDAAWPDAAGKPLTAGVQKKIAIVAPAAARLDPKAWELIAPKDATSPLEVRFPAPLDRALLNRMLTVTDANGTAVPGKIEVTDAEKTWRFVPEKPWTPGEYSLAIGVDLEDVAGNRPDRVFDADPEAAADDRPATLSRPFRVPGK